MVYDIVLDVVGYGWSDMIAWADYVADTEGRGDATYRAGHYNTPELTWERLFAGKVSQKLNPDEEYTFLTVKVYSWTLHAYVEITWFNQSRALRIITDKDVTDPVLRRYAESIIRRNFGTKDAMKPARPKQGTGKQ